jgi:hypothetical protein
MNTILETAPFSLSIELAAIAARRDFLNLEKWLQDNLTIHRDSFFQVRGRMRILYNPMWQYALTLLSFSFLINQSFC